MPAGNIDDRLAGFAPVRSADGIDLVCPLVCREWRDRYGECSTPLEFRAALAADGRLESDWSLSPPSATPIMAMGEAGEGLFVPALAGPCACSRLKLLSKFMFRAHVGVRYRLELDFVECMPEPSKPASCSEGLRTPDMAGDVDGISMIPTNCGRHRYHSLTPVPAVPSWPVECDKARSVTDRIRVAGS